MSEKQRETECKMETKTACGDGATTSRYDDIINLPHYHEPGKPYMSVRDRAAQFAPYKSLVGYEGMIEEKADELYAIDERADEFLEMED